MRFPVMKGVSSRGRTVFDLDGDANTPYVAPARKIPDAGGVLLPPRCRSFRRVSVAKCSFNHKDLC